MSAPSITHLDRATPSVPTEFDAYIPVRVTHAPRPDGSLLVYLPNGTAVVVNSRYLLFFDQNTSRPG